MKVSCFSIVKNEAEYIGYCIMSILPYIGEMVWYDGNSTDGTIEIIKYIQKKYDKEGKIKLFENKDCKDLQDDYVRLFNECVQSCTGDYVWFLHPDMICVNPKLIKNIGKDGALRYHLNVVSVAGEKREKIIVKGRQHKWYTIYKNDLGLHYYGYYGTPEEDLYFREITGDKHIIHNDDAWLPYTINDSKLSVIHYCDTKPYDRRLNRMVKCLLNSNKFSDMRTAKDICESFAKGHPRVTLKSGDFEGLVFKFKKNTTHLEVFNKYKKEFEPLRRK